MGVNIGNWNLTVPSQETIRAFVESTKLPVNSYIKKNMTDAKVVFPQLANLTVTKKADNSAMADAGSTEGGVTVSADTPDKVWCYIPLSEIETNQSYQLDSEYATQFGRQLANHVEKKITNLICTSPGGNAPTPTTYDDESATLGTEVASKLVTIIQNFEESNVDDLYFGALKPSAFLSLWNVAGTRSSDFISGADNARAFKAIDFLGMHVVAANYNFGVDTSADAAYDSQYQINMSGATGIHGCFWARSAVGVNYWTMPRVDASVIDDSDAVLVRARMVMGAKCLRNGAARQILRGDA